MDNVIETSYLILKAEESEKDKIRNLIKKISGQFPGKITEKPRTGIISHKFIVRIKAEKEFSHIIEEQLAAEEVVVLKEKKEIDELISLIKQQKDEASRLKYEEELRIRGIEKKALIEKLNSYVISGNYKEILKHCLDRSINTEVIKTAKELLPSATTIAIEEIFHKGKEPAEGEKSFDHLIAIASNRDLISLNQQDNLNRAGLSAIELCLLHSNIFSKLLELMKNKNVTNEVSVKAALVFWQKVNEMGRNGKGLIFTAAKNVNLRILNDKFNEITGNLSAPEKKIYNEFYEAMAERQSV